ncbi:NAD-dependent dehydratase [candidate division WOR_3 bacterium SM23_42]|uniref:NAD-dependent dehydratase n=1 Tax=candidate division WOR_3 bacterium SM23_42 TaxID=1703779 RepID=A0A0S8FVQ1_UNCW3|nr:MAG: NAD-dependent dehydratase [candidate division WOR_3 bacterium SM23_42]
MRVLITGGAGFIGSHLVDYYIQQGCEVVVVDNFITGREENVAQHLTSKQFTLIKSDVCDTFEIEGELHLILHLASPASPFDYLRYPIETMRTASLGTHNMLEITKAKQAKMLLASTSEVYGDPEEHPQTEDYWGNVNPVGPRAVYDEGKRFAEALTAAYNRKYGVNTCIVRIFNTYGERMREGDGRVIPAFINQALRNEPFTIFGDGTQTRSFCYVSDMIDGITRAAKTDYNLPINVGNPMEYTMLEVAEMIKEKCESDAGNKFLPLPEDDPKRRKPDISRARDVLGWEPKVTLDTGLKSVIDWFRRKM